MDPKAGHWFIRAKQDLDVGQRPADRDSQGGALPIVGARRGGATRSPITASLRRVLVSIGLIRP